MNEREKSIELMRVIIFYQSVGDIDGLKLWLSEYNVSEHSIRENVSVLRTLYVLKSKIPSWNNMYDEIEELIINKHQNPLQWLVGLNKE